MRVFLFLKAGWTSARRSTAVPLSNPSHFWEGCYVLAIQVRGSSSGSWSRRATSVAFMLPLVTARACHQISVRQEEITTSIFNQYRLGSYQRPLVMPLRLHDGWAFPTFGSIGSASFRMMKRTGSRNQHRWFPYIRTHTSLLLLLLQLTQTMAFCFLVLRQNISRSIQKLVCHKKNFFVIPNFLSNVARCF